MFKGRPVGQPVRQYYEQYAICPLEMAKWRLDVLINRDIRCLRDKLHVRE